MIADDLKAFFESGVSLVLATRESALVPEFARGWGPRVGPDRTSLAFCIARDPGQQTICNLRNNGQIAASFCLPSNYRTVQLKGCLLEIAEPSAMDFEAIDSHLKQYDRLKQGLGVPPNFVMKLYQLEVGEPPSLVRIRMEGRRFFDQTPGPGAGRSL